MQQICDVHLLYVKFVCVENSCQSKLLCDECQKQSSKHATHKVLDYVSFMNSIESFIKGQPANTSVYGSDIQSKTSLYLQSTEHARQELRQTHLKTLEEGCDLYLKQLSEGLLKAKKVMIEFVQEAADMCYSHQILTNRDSLKEVCMLMLETLENNVSSREANTLFVKLHNGQLEREYQEEKIRALVELFQNHMKQILDPLAIQVNKYLGKFSKEVENLKDQIRAEHFQINQSNMGITRPQTNFKIREFPMNQNQHLKINVPKSLIISPERRYLKTQPSELLPPPTNDLDRSIEASLKLFPIKQISKDQINNLLRSLDYTKRINMNKSSSNAFRLGKPSIIQRHDQQ